MAVVFNTIYCAYRPFLKSHRFMNNVLSGISPSYIDYFGMD